MSEVRETKKTKLIAFRVTDEEYAHLALLVLNSTVRRGRHGVVKYMH